MTVGIVIAVVLAIVVVFLLRKNAADKARKK